MIRKINKTQEIQEQLSKEGKFRYLDKPEDIAADLIRNAKMEEVRKDYKRKDQESNIRAADAILTT